MQFNMRFFIVGLFIGFILGVVLFVASAAIDGSGPPDPGNRPSPNPGPVLQLPREYQ